MPPTRRYADWRPVATARMPARWIGLFSGSLAFVALSLLMRNPQHLTYMASVALAAFVSNRVAARRLAVLRDEGEDRQFAATLRLTRGTAYGYDEGLLAFEDGYLVYMGRRCAFSLGARDVSVKKMAENECEFTFRGRKGDHTAHLQWQKNEDVLESIVRWRKAERRSCESVLPPAVPDSSYSRAVILFVSALPWLVFAVACLLTRWNGPSERLISFGVSSLALVATFVFVRSVARELRRIELGERRAKSLVARIRKRQRLARRKKGRFAL